MLSVEPGEKPGDLFLLIIINLTIQLSQLQTKSVLDHTGTRWLVAGDEDILCWLWGDRRSQARYYGDNHTATTHPPHHQHSDIPTHGPHHQHSDLPTHGPHHQHSDLPTHGPHHQVGLDCSVALTMFEWTWAMINTLSKGIYVSNIQHSTCL